MNQTGYPEEKMRLTLGSHEDLPMVHDLIRKQFPREEIYQIRDFIQMVNNDKYKILLYRRESDQELIGYATTFSMITSETVWLDLFAILPEYQSRGYGKQLFDAVYHKYCGMFDGLVMCAEHIDPSDPEKAEIQRRRLAFYKKAGAHLLQTDFLLPTEEGSFPMHLLFKPKRGIQELARESQLQIVRDMYEYCYGHIKHRHELFNQVKDTITDENFLMRD